MIEGSDGLTSDDLSAACWFSGFRAYLFARLQVCQQTGYLLPGCTIRLKLGGGTVIHHAVLESHALVDNDR
jgi:hypothetical protein